MIISITGKLSINKNGFQSEKAINLASVYSYDTDRNYVISEQLPIENTDIIKLIEEGVLTKQQALMNTNLVPSTIESAINSEISQAIIALNAKNEITGEIIVNKDGKENIFHIENAESLVRALSTIEKMTPKNQFDLGTTKKFSAGLTFSS